MLPRTAYQSLPNLVLSPPALEPWARLLGQQQEMTQKPCQLLLDAPLLIVGVHSYPILSHAHLGPLGW